MNVGEKKNNKINPLQLNTVVVIWYKRQWSVTYALRETSNEILKKGVGGGIAATMKPKLGYRFHTYRGPIWELA